MLFQSIIRDAKKAALTGKQSRVVQQLLESGRFILDDNSTRAMTRLSMMKPSKIVAAKDFLKLPFGSVWIEYPDPVRDDVMRNGGWNMQDINDVRADKAGFLIWDDPASPDHIFIWYLYSSSSPDLRSKWEVDFNWTPFVARINTSMDNLEQDRVSRNLDDLTDGARDLEPGDGLYYEVRNKPEELAAAAIIAASCDVHVCPLVEKLPFIQDLVRNRHEERNREYIAQCITSARDHVYLALASILLLNCKSGFTREDVAPEPKPSTKIQVGNKYKRAANQKYTILRMRVPKGAMGTGSVTETRRAAHWVMGHPKVRKTGIFWWSPHIRGVGAAPESPRTRLVKA